MASSMHWILLLLQGFNEVKFKSSEAQWKSGALKLYFLSLKHKAFAHLPYFYNMFRRKLEPYSFQVINLHFVRSG